jgi:glycosyltransferase involved in cell wall biosynthesis
MYIDFALIHCYSEPMKNTYPELSVIIACYNEEASIEHCISRVIGVLPGAEILVVDGGSDSTESLVTRICEQSPEVRYIRNDNDQGKGHAIRVGISKARGNIITQCDADLQFLPEEIPRLLEPISEDRADFVMGSRFAKGSCRRPGSTPPLRTFGNKLVSGFASLTYAHPITDVMAGAKAWRKEVTDSFALTSPTFSYELELIAKSIRKGWRVAEVAVTTDPRTSGESSVHVFEHGMEVLRDIVRFKFQNQKQL